MKENKKTVTIGMAAYNEAANIGYLLEDLNSQIKEDFLLEKIIVVSDASSDRTAEIAQIYEKDGVEAIKGKERRGKSARINQIMDACKSDILVLLDADILIKDRYFISKLIKPLAAGEAELSAGLMKALKASTITEKALSASHDFKLLMFERVKQGSNFYTCNGAARAMAKSLYKDFRFDQSIGEDVDLYLYMKKAGRIYHQAAEAVFYIKLPSNIDDYIKQSSRYVKSKHLLEEKYGKKLVHAETHIPLFSFFEAFILAIAKKRFFLLVYCCLFLYVRLYANRRMVIRDNWTQAQSSKQTRVKQIGWKRRLLIYARRFIYLSVNFFDRIFNFKRPSVSVYCYHSISDNAWRHSVSPDIFIKQMEFLLEHYQPLEADDLMDFLDGEKDIGEEHFVVTFDDGYRNITEISDYLRDKGIKPILFPLSDVERIDRRQLGSDLEVLGSGDIRSLLAKGWELGSHGATHADLATLEPIALEQEINGSKSELEKKFGRKVEYFAYPKGRYNERVKQAIKSSSYKLAFSMDDEIFDRDSNRYALPRVGVDSTHSLGEFRVLNLWPSVYFRKLLRRYFNI